MIKLSKRQRVRRKNVAMLVCLLMVLSLFAASPPPVLASPPTWGSVANVNYSCDNPTLAAVSKHDISFTLGTSIDVAGSTPDNMIVLEIGSSFDCSGIVENNIGLKDETGAIEHSAYWNPNTRKLAICPSASVATGDTLTISIPGVKNPDWEGYYCFASLYLEDMNGQTSNLESINVNVIAPTLVISPDTLTMDLEMRNEITISMMDAKGAALNTPADLRGYLYGTWGGEFYHDKADVVQNNCFIIPTGQSSAIMYYRATSAGTQQLYNDNIWGYQGGTVAPAYSPNITVNPIPAIDTYATLSFSNWPSTIAGEPVRVDLQLYCQDQQERPVAQDKDVVVDIAAFSAYHSDAQAIPETARLLKADDNGNLVSPDTVVTQVTIPKDGNNAGWAYFYFQDTRSTTSAYQVILEAAAENLNVPTCQVNVDPAPSTEVKITAPDSSITTLQRLPLNIQLFDRFGNLADPQPPTLGVMLNSSSSSGRFYEQEWSNTPVDRITFSPGWWSIEGHKTVYYVNPVGSTTPDTITAEASYLTPGQLQVSVSNAPTLTVAPVPTGDIKVNLFKKLTLQLIGADGNAIIAGGENGIPLNLHRDNWSGKFYPQPSDNVATITSTKIPAGQSEVAVFYKASSPGTEKLWFDTPDFGGISSSPYEFTVTPADQTGSSLLLNPGGPFTAGVPGKVNISYSGSDQYGDPIPLTQDLVVNLEAFNNGTPVTPDSWRFYASDADGKVATPDVVTVTIPKDSGQASFYYSDTRATTSDYQPGIKASASGVENSRLLDIKPNVVSRIGVEALEDTKTINEAFPIKVSLFDQYGNAANPQQKPLTVELLSYIINNPNPDDPNTPPLTHLPGGSQGGGQSGNIKDVGQFFYNPYNSSPITQLTFNQYPDSSKRTIYFRPSTADTITVFASTITTIANIKNGFDIINVTPAAALSWVTNPDPVEVNIYKKLTLQLAAEASDDVFINLSNDQPGCFFTQAVNNYYPVYSVVIPAGSKSVDVYYQSNVVGTHILNANTSAFGGVSAQALEVTVTPAGQVIARLMLTGYDSGVAGEKIPVTVKIRDQYHNLVPQGNDLTVDLQALQPDGREVSASSRFYQADPDGNATETTTDTLLIPAGKSSGLVYYYDEKATTGPSTDSDPGYSLFIRAEAIGIVAAEMPIFIEPAMAKAIRVNTPMGTSRSTLQAFPLEVSLHDAFGNLAQPQSTMISLDLVSSSPTGRFFAPEGPNGELRQIAQLNFQGTSQRSVFYCNETASTTPDSISISTTDLTGVTLALTVIPPPVITLAAQNLSPEVNLFDKLTITLDKPLDYDLTLALDTNNAGQFFLNASNNSNDTDRVEIPQGSQSTELWYRPANVGIHTITALVNYPIGQASSNKVELNVQPAGQVVFGNRISMSVPDAFVAGEKGKVVLEITDQYNNPVKQAAELQVKLQGSRLDGEPLSTSAKFYEANPDGSASTKDISIVTVPANESSVVFYYYDEKATAPADPDYKISISASADNLEDCVLPVNVLPAPAAQVSITAENGNARPVYDQFELLLELLDQFGNPALPQQEPVTVVLSSTTSETTGRFYDANHQRITQLTFAEGNPAGAQAHKVYYVDSEPNEAIELSASAPNLDAGKETVKVLPMPKAIKLGFGPDSWLIKQRSPVKLSLFVDEAAGTNYTVPADMEGGLNVQLSSNPAGRFYDAVVEGNELEDGVLNIPAGTLVKDLLVYFAPDSAGDVEITAGLSYAGSSYSGPGGKADIVWVLDHSGSMGDDQQNIANNITAFANQLQSSGINCRLGFNYYANNIVTREYFSSDLFTQDTTAFANQLIAISRTCSGSGEVTMEAVQNALGYPFAGSKNIIIVTDEPGDDNHIYAATQAAVDASGARVYAVWEPGLSPYSKIGELADKSGGLQIPISGEWSSILSTLATSIISGTKTFDLVTSDSIKVASAGGVRAVLLCDEITAGQPEKIQLYLIDQYNNLTTWPADIEVNLRAVMEDGNYSASGKFYKADADGNIITADSISSVIIPKNTESIFIYYQDSRASSPDYEIRLQTSALPVEGYQLPVYIAAGSCTRVDLQVFDWPEYFDLNIDNLWEEYQWSLPGIDGEQHKLLSGEFYPVKINIVDVNGNPVPMSTPLTVNLSSNIATTTPDNVEVLFYADIEGKFPITQVTIPAGIPWVNVFFVKGIGQGKDTLRAQAAELGNGSAASWDITVLQPDRLKIVFPGEFPDENGDYPTPEVEPDLSKAFYVLLTDSEGHPAVADRDIEVQLSGSSNNNRLVEFYMDKEMYWPLKGNALTIKAGSHGFAAYVKGAREEGDMSIEAKEGGETPTLTGSGAVPLKVVAAPCFYRPLENGWNIISTPVRLDPAYASLDSVLEVNGTIGPVYTYDAARERWVQVYKDGDFRRLQQGDAANTSSDRTAGEDPEFVMQPWQALYVKLEGGGGMAKFYPYREISQPSTLVLQKGWNLLGPSLDVRNECTKPVEAVLANIGGKYSQVISPGYGWQLGWSYVPGSYSMHYSEKIMQAGCGYWLYMKEDNALLPGSGVTPISQFRPWYLAETNHSLQEVSLVETASPPAIPAAYYGTVNYPDGTPVSGGTIEAMIDGVVYGSAEVKDGRFCTPNGAHLLVAYINDTLKKKVEFLVNGVKAEQTGQWPYDSGDVVEISLTVAQDTVAPVFRDFSIDASGKVISLNFSEILQSNVTDLKSMVKCSTDGINFNALTAGDSVAINGKAVVITLASALSGDSNQFLIAAGALKDLSGHVLDSEVRTEARDKQAPVYEKAIFDSSDKQVVTLQFSEKLIENTPNLKAAVTIARDGKSFVPLGDGDQVIIKDNQLVITLATPISGDENRFRVAAGALKDATGNQTTAVETGAILAEGCFIATAAYGSYLDPHVWALRQFRDRVLLQSSWGTWFVNSYYKNSPAVAAYIAQHNSLRLMTRVLLTPLVLAVEYPGLALSLLFFLLLLAVWSHKRQRVVNPC